MSAVPDHWSNDIVDAAFLSEAAYLGKDENGNDQTAEEHLQSVKESHAEWTTGDSWVWIPPAIYTSEWFDANGYFDNFLTDTQALVAYNNDTNTLAIAFRGTQQPADLVTDGLNGTLKPWLFKNAYDSADRFVKNVLNNSRPDRILITGHSLGGALVEETMARDDDPRMVGVSFGSPGINDLDVSTAPDENLINLGHSSLPAGSSDWLRGSQGDPVYRRIAFNRVQGVDIPVDQPDRPDYGMIYTASQRLLGRDYGQHQLSDYAHTAMAISRELTNSQNRSHPFYVSDPNYIIVGNPASATVTGTTGFDVIVGEAGSDTINGGVGNDILDGGDGDDTLTGGYGDDTIYGGKGIDTAVFVRAFDQYIIRGNGGEITVRLATKSPRHLTGPTP